MNYNEVIYTSWQQGFILWRSYILNSLPYRSQRLKSTAFCFVWETTCPNPKSDGFQNHI